MTLHLGGDPEIAVLPDAAAVSEAAADRIARALAAAVGQRGRADWATTGGSAPPGIYRALGAPRVRALVDWDLVHVWWGDDRFVPRDHPLSNVLPFDQVLLAASAWAGLSGTGADGAMVQAGTEPGLAFRPSNVHAPPMAEAIAEHRDTAWVASAYERDLRAAGLPVDDAGFPRFDLVLLGVGPDGHVMSVFPDSELFDSERWVSGVPAPMHVEPHVARISLNPAVLAAASLLVVVAHGSEKAAILADVLEGDVRPRRLPAQLARRGNAAWFLDAAAASRLRR